MSRNQGLEGDVTPAIMPERRVRTARLPVESIILRLRRSPLFESVIEKRARLGKRKSDKSRQCDMNDWRSFSSCALKRSSRFQRPSTVCGVRSGIRVYSLSLLLGQTQDDRRRNNKSTVRHWSFDSCLALIALWRLRAFSGGSSRTYRASLTKQSLLRSASQASHIS